MRILLLTDLHSPKGGAEKYFFELKDKLKNQPNMHIFSLGFSKCTEKGADYLTLPATRTKWSKLFWQIFTHRKTYRLLRQAIIDFKPDIIHAHNVKDHSAAIFKAIEGYRCVHTIHDYGIVCPVAFNLHKNLQPCPTGFRLSCFTQHQLKFNRLVYLGLVFSFLLMQKRLKKSIHHFMTVSPLLAGYTRNNGFQPVTYIPPFKQAESSTTEISAKQGYFLFAGNLGAHKGTEVLIQEFALACEKNPALHLTLAGSGNNETKLKSLVHTLKLDNHITFTGWINNLDPLYQSHAVVIVPSLWMEAFGLIIADAMTQKRAVIGSNRGSIPWLIDDNQTGCLFDPTKKGDLAEKILHLAANPLLAAQFGNQGYLKINRLIDNEQSLKQIIQIYRETMLSPKHVREPLPLTESAINQLADDQ